MMINKLEDKGDREIMEKEELDRESAVIELQTVLIRKRKERLVMTNSTNLDSNLTNNGKRLMKQLYLYKETQQTPRIYGKNTYQT